MLNAKNILIVDIDGQFVDYVGNHLERQNFNVHVAPDAYTAQALVKQMRVHVALVSISLLNADDSNDLSGIQLAINLAPYTRVIMTAKNPTFQMVRRALATQIDGPAPACEFIRKEEGIAPMLTIIQKVLSMAVETVGNSHMRGNNRPIPAPNFGLHPLSSDRFVLDINTRVATVDGNDIPLTEREYRIVSYFMDHSETVITREDIVDKILNEIYDPIADSNRVNNIISRLRKKIEPDADHPQFIVTRWGSGWMFYTNGNAPQIF